MSKKKPLKASENITENLVIAEPDTCKTCRFWEHLKEGQGRCRRTPYIINGAVTDYGPLGVFPITKYNDWCGGFQSIDKSLSLPIK